MATQIGKAQIFGLDGALLVSGYATIIWESIRVSTVTNKERIVGMDGEVQAVIYSGKIIEATIDFIPSGASITAARATCTIPADGSQVELQNLPSISLLGISNVLNSALWVTEGGNVNGVKDSKWTVSLNIARYPSITNTSALS